MDKSCTKGRVIRTLTVISFSIFFYQISSAEPIIKEADSPRQSWYATIMGGGSYSTGWNLPARISAVTGVAGRVSGETGWNASVAFGRQHGPWRLEGQLLYMEHTDRNISVTGIAPAGFAFDWDTKVGAAMANLYLDFHNYHGPLKPYIGAGIGVAHVRNRTTIGAAALPNMNFGGSNNELAYQGIAGVTYNYSNSGFISLDYRYFTTNRVRFTGNRFKSQSINLGISQRFDI